MTSLFTEGEQCEHNASLICDTQQSQYILYGAIIHSGKSAEFGHYYSIARNSSEAINEYTNNNKKESKWYMFNDSRVSNSSFKSISNLKKYFKNDVPYMLFYQRIPNIISKQQNKTENNNENDTENDTEMTNNNQNKDIKYEWKTFIEKDNELFEKEIKKYETQTTST